MLKQLAPLSTVLLGLLLARSLRADVDFTREIRPILAQHCFKCHGIDEGARKGNLRLDRREDATKSGESGAIAITPGSPEKSELIRRIVSRDSDEIMPPPTAKHALAPTQIALLTEWVREGAKYRPHWSFEPPAHTPPPTFQANKHLSPIPSTASSGNASHKRASARHNPLPEKHSCDASALISSAFRPRHQKCMPS